MGTKQTGGAQLATPAPPPVPDGKPFKPEDYHAVTREAQLSTINLLDCRFRVKPELFNEREGEDSRRKFFFGGHLENQHYDAERGLASGQFTWKVEVKVSRKKAVSLVAIFIIVYENLEGMNANAVEAFVNRVGRFATYPYFRALASQLSWEAGVELPIMPVISSTR